MQNMEIEKEVQVSVIVPNYNYARYLPMRIAVSYTHLTLPTKA